MTLTSYITELYYSQYLFAVITGRTLHGTKQKRKRRIHQNAEQEVGRQGSRDSTLEAETAGAEPHVIANLTRSDVTI